MTHESATADPAPGFPPQAARPGRRRVWSALAWLGLVGGAVAVCVARPELVGRGREIVVEGWRRGHALLVPAAPAAKPPPRVVAVNTAEARKQDLDLFYDALGSVTAFETVTLRSRVDGELVNVAFQEGQFVKKGDLVAEIDPRPFQVQLRQAEGQLARDEAALKAASLDLERYQSLADIRQITAQQIDAQRALVRQSEAAIQIDRGLIDNVRLQLEFCRITAPISGRIGLRLVDSGNIVRANDPNGLAVIVEVQPIAIVFTIPQDEIFRVQRALAESGRLPVEAYNRDFRTRLATGSLLAIDNQVDAATGTVKLKAVFPNEDQTLFPNQFVNARLLVERLTDVTVVPAVAVQRGPESSFVYVAQPDSTAALRPVRTGPAQGDLIAIVEGIEPGEQVVTDGIDKISNKARIAVRSPADRASGAAAVATGTAPRGTSGVPRN
ncbi:MAG: MdtA/MuxA family multidrug efflux RND transporter periplasmic adaptor subunit [Planctomycetia bacterium]